MRRGEHGRKVGATVRVEVTRDRYECGEVLIRALHHYEDGFRRENSRSRATLQGSIPATLPDVWEALFDAVLCAEDAVGTGQVEMIVDTDGVHDWREAMLRTLVWTVAYERKIPVRGPGSEAQLSLW